jgi:hypothetical protein
MSDNTTIKDKQEDICLTEFCRSVLHELAQLQLETDSLKNQLKAERGAKRILAIRNKELSNGNTPIQAN